MTRMKLMLDVMWHQGSWHLIVQIHIYLLYIPLFLFACPFIHHLYNYSHIYLQSVWIIYIYINVTQSALLFTYKNVKQSAMILHIKMPLPSCQFQNSMKNCVTRRVQIFVYKTYRKLFWFLWSVWSFVNKTVTYRKVSCFLYINANFKIFMKNCVIKSFILFVYIK